MESDSRLRAHPPVGRAAHFRAAEAEAIQEVLHVFPAGNTGFSPRNTLAMKRGAKTSSTSAGTIPRKSRRAYRRAAPVA